MNNMLNINLLEVFHFVLVLNLAGNNQLALKDLNEIYLCICKQTN